MKRFNIIASLAALCALLAACQKTNVGGSLANLQVSRSYVSLPATADRIEKITVTAVEDWKFDCTIPDWVTIDPLSGAAGETEVTFTAVAASDACSTAELKIVSGTETQFVVVQQGEPVVKELTIKEVNDGPVGATYRVTGVCSSIEEIDVYGNWNITDETGTIYIYGTKYEGQTKQAALKKLNIEVGDVVTIEGPKTVYNGKNELVDVDVLKVVKSLVKIADATPEYFAAKDGGDVNVKLIVKGGHLDINPKADWLLISKTSTIKAVKAADPDTTVVTFKALANDGAPRTGEVDFTSGTSTVSASIAQDGANVPIGTLEIGKPCFVRGQVTGIDARGFVLSDETGSVLYYDAKYDKGYNIGDYVEIKCSKVTDYQGAFQLDVANVTYCVKVDEGTYTYPDPEQFGPEELSNFIAANGKGLARYITFVGTPSGSYLNVSVDGTTNVFAPYQLTAEMKAQIKENETYQFRGWLIGFTSNRANVVITEFTPAARYVKVSAVESGLSYLIVAKDGNGKSKSAGLLEGKSYGYPSGNPVIVYSDGTLCAGAIAQECVITSTTDGYTICFGGKYIYQTGTYNSVNWSDNPPSGQYWDIQFEAGTGACTITNKAVSKWLQLDPSYGTYGSYNTAKGALPCLYAKKTI